MAPLRPGIDYDEDLFEEKVATVTPPISSDLPKGAGIEIPVGPEGSDPKFLSQDELKRQRSVSSLKPGVDYDEGLFDGPPKEIPKATEKDIALLPEDIRKKQVQIGPSPAFLGIPGTEDFNRRVNDFNEMSARFNEHFASGATLGATKVLDLVFKNAVEKAFPGFKTPEREEIPIELLEKAPELGKFVGAQMAGDFLGNLTSYKALADTIGVKAFERSMVAFEKTIPITNRLRISRALSDMATFSAQPAIRSVFEALAGEKRKAIESLKSVPSQALFGAIFGPTGLIEAPLKRTITQALVAGGFSKLTGGSNLDATLTAGLFALFGIANFKNIRDLLNKARVNDFKQAAIQRVQSEGGDVQGASRTIDKVVSAIYQKAVKLGKVVTPADFERAAVEIRKGAKIGPVEPPETRVAPSKTPEPEVKSKAVKTAPAELPPEIKGMIEKAGGSKPSWQFKEMTGPGGFVQFNVPVPGPSKSATISMKAKDITPESVAKRIEEKKKEFAQSKTKPKEIITVFKGGAKPFDADFGMATTTDMDMAEAHQKLYGEGAIQELKISSSKMLNFDDIPNELKQDYKTMQSGDFTKKLVAYAKAKGYDAIDMRAGPEKEIKIIDPKIIQKPSVSEEKPSKKERIETVKQATKTAKEGIIESKQADPTKVKKALLEKLQKVYQSLPADEPITSIKQYGTVNIKIPGDGDFTIVKSKANLAKIMKSVRGLETGKGWEEYQEPSARRAAAKFKTEDQFLKAPKGYVTTGKFLALGEPPKGAKFEEREITEEQAKRILNAPATGELKLVQYETGRAADEEGEYDYGISQEPIRTNVEGKEIPIRAVFQKEDGDFVFANQNNVLYFLENFKDPVFKIGKPGIGEDPGDILVESEGKRVGVIRPLVYVQGGAIGLKKPSGVEVRKKLVFKDWPIRQEGEKWVLYNPQGNIAAKADTEYDAKVIRAKLQQSEAKFQKSQGVKEPEKEVSPQASEELPEFKSDPSLINEQIAMRAHAGTSHTPEVRGRQAIAGFAEEVQRVYEGWKDKANTPESRKLLIEEMERFQKAYAEKTNALLSAHSGLVSSMIAGPSKFNVSRAQKRTAAYDKKVSEVLEWKKRALAAVGKRLSEKAVQEAGGEDVVLSKKIADLEKLQETMKEVNEIVRRSISDEEKIRLITPLIGEKNAVQILKPDYAGRIGFAPYQLTNNLANINRLKKKLATIKETDALSGTETIGEFEGVRIENNHDIQRVQIFFDQKPSDPVIADLKASGWHWSPSSGSWQRKNTQDAILSAQRIVEKHFPAKEKPKEEGALQSEEASVSSQEEVGMPFRKEEKPAPYQFMSLSYQDFRPNKGKIGDAYFPMKMTDEEIKKRINPSLFEGLSSAKYEIFDKTGLHLTVSSSIRTTALQQKLKELGYETEEQSKHLTGEAADIVLRNSEGKILNWNDISEVQKGTIKEIFNEQGLDYKEYKDYEHLHITVASKAPTKELVKEEQYGEEIPEQDLERAKREESAEAAERRKGERSVIEKPDLASDDPSRIGRAPEEVGLGDVYAEPTDPQEEAWEQEIPNSQDMPVRLEKPEGAKAATPAPEIIESLAQILEAAGREIPIRNKHFRNKALGIFKVHPEVIRVLVANNIPSAAHEVFHALEKAIYGWSKGGAWTGRNITPEMQRELAHLGHLLYISRVPKGGYKREGFAEFGRMYLTDQDQAKKLAPKFFEWFEGKFLKLYPEIAKAIENSKKLIDSWKEAGSVARVKASVVDLGSMKERVRRAKKTIKNIFNLEAWWEMLEPINKMAREAEARLGRKLEAGEDPYTIGKALRHAHEGRTTYMVEHGMIDLAGNIVGPPLNDIRAIVAGQKVNFTAYLVGKRAETLWLDRERGPRNPGMSLADAQQTIKELETPKFQLAAQKLYDWFDGALNYAAQGSPEFARVVEKIRATSSGYYVPFQRYLDEVEDIISKGGGGASAMGGSISKRLKGSGLRIKDIFPQAIANVRNIVKATHNRIVIDRILKLSKVEGLGRFAEEIPKDRIPVKIRTEDILRNMAKAGLEVSGEEMTPEELLESMPIGETMTFFMEAQYPKGKEPIVAVMEGGKLVWYQLDPELMQALESLEVPMVPHVNAMVDLALNALHVQKQMLTLGATGINPTFSLVRNWIKDLPAGMIQSQARANPFQFLMNWFSSMGGALVSSLTGKMIDPYFDLYIRLGGGMAQMLSQDIAHTRRAARRLFETTGMQILDVRNWWDYVREVLQFPESATRIAEVKSIMRDLNLRPGDPISFTDSIKILLAGKEVTTDFSSGGNFGRQINLYLPFFNPTIMGLRAMLRAAKRNPKKFLLRGLALTALSLIAWWLAKDTKWWKRALTTREKLIYWWFESNVGGRKELVRIPMPYELGLIFGGIPVSMMDAAYRKDPKMAIEFFRVALDVMLPNFLPPIINESVSQMMNKDLFWETPIVKKGLERKPAKEQYTEYTTKAAIYMGQLFDISPDRIDHAIRGLFGPVGIDFVSLFGKGSRERNIEKEPADIPLVGTLFKRGGPMGTNPRVVQEMYETLEEAQLKQASDETPETPKERELRLMLSDAADAVSAMNYISKQTEDVDIRRKLNGMRVKFAVEAMRRYKAEIPERRDLKQYGKEFIKEAEARKILDKFVKSDKDLLRGAQFFNYLQWKQKTGGISKKEKLAALHLFARERKRVHGK